jgi:hypothetical protein
VNYWLEHFKKDLEAIKKCQDIEGADDNSMIELFKYFTKIVTKKKAIPPENLNEIFIAIRQMHTVRPFGFQVLLPEDEEEIEFNLESKEMSELNIYGWEQDLHDWVAGRDEIRVHLAEGGVLAAYAGNVLNADVLEPSNIFFFHIHNVPFCLCAGHVPFTLSSLQRGRKRSIRCLP